MMHPIKKIKQQLEQAKTLGWDEDGERDYSITLTAEQAKLLVEHYDFLFKIAGEYISTDNYAKHGMKK